MGSSFSRFGMFFFYAHYLKIISFLVSQTFSCSSHAFFLNSPLTFTAWFGSSTLSASPNVVFHMIHFSGVGFHSGAPRLSGYWLFHCQCCFCFVLDFFSNSNSVQFYFHISDWPNSFLNFIYLFVFVLGSIFVSSLNCLNIVIMIHLNSSSGSSPRLFLLGAIIMGWVILQQDIISWFFMLFYFCAEICESEVVFSLIFLSFCLSPFFFQRRCWQYSGGH